MKFSICLNTHQVMRPMIGTDKDIFSILTDRLKKQSLQDFELIIVDRLFDERKESFDKLRLPFPFKYLLPKPSPWWDVDPGAITIASDRNSGILMAQGDIIICLDDCVVPMHSDFLSQVWRWWKRDILLRPLISSYDFSKGCVKINRDPLLGWMEDQPFKSLHQASGLCPKCYLFPAGLYEQVNGFDERLDGAWSQEDTVFYESVDALGSKRYILGQEHQHHVGSIHHSHPLRDRRDVDIYNVCNYAYAHWVYGRIRDHHEVRANARVLNDHDIAGIGSMCGKCPITCGKKTPPGLEYYRRFQPVFDLAAERVKMIEQYGSVNGVVRPWE